MMGGTRVLQKELDPPSLWLLPSRELTPHPCGTAERRVSVLPCTWQSQQTPTGIVRVVSLGGPVCAQRCSSAGASPK